MTGFIAAKLAVVVFVLVSGTVAKRISAHPKTASLAPASVTCLLMSSIDYYESYHDSFYALMSCFWAILTLVALYAFATTERGVS